jgi:hypothetical protein
MRGLRMDSEEKPGSPGGVDGESHAEEWVPLSVREARRARKVRDETTSEHSAAKVTANAISVLNTSMVRV